MTIVFSVFDILEIVYFNYKYIRDDIVEYKFKYSDWGLQNTKYQVSDPKSGLI